MRFVGGKACSIGFAVSSVVLSRYYIEFVQINSGLSVRFDVDFKGLVMPCHGRNLVG